MAQVGAGLEKLKYENTSATAVSNGMDVSAYVVNGRVNAGPARCGRAGARRRAVRIAPYGRFQPNTGTGNLTIGGAACGDAGKAKMITLGYDYVMSKRTKMYFAYNKIDNGISTNYYYIAGRQRTVVARQRRRASTALRADFQPHGRDDLGNRHAALVLTQQEKQQTKAPSGAFFLDAICSVAGTGRSRGIIRTAETGFQWKSQTPHASILIAASSSSTRPCGSCTASRSRADAVLLMPSPKKIFATKYAATRRP